MHTQMHLYPIGMADGILAYKKELFDNLMNQGIKLITKVKKEYKTCLYLSLWDKLMLRKRTIIETVIGQLYIINQIKPTFRTNYVIENDL